MYLLMCPTHSSPTNLFSIHISSLSRVLSIICITLPSSTSLATYLPIDAVLGDFDTVITSRPKVVLNYLAVCANVSFADLNPCVMKGFLDLLEQPSPRFFNTTSCQAPSTSFADIKAVFGNVASTCSSKGSSGTAGDGDIGASLYFTVVSKSQCWKSLCDDSILQSIESKWLNTCAGVQLPFPPESKDMLLMSARNEKEDVFLTCMLEYTMDSPASTFGLTDPPTDSPLRCYPPGSDSLTDECPDIGQKAFSECKARLVGANADITAPPGNMHMSYSYDIVDHKDEIIVDFCELIHDLSTAGARKCLLELCELGTSATQSPVSGSPMAIPDRQPTSGPTASRPPSQSSGPLLPTPTTAAPLRVLSLSPTRAPTSAPVQSSTPAPAPLLTSGPTLLSTQAPARAPTSSQAPAPAPAPAPLVTSGPTRAPTSTPGTHTTLAPTRAPTSSPGTLATSAPAATPTRAPTSTSTLATTLVPTRTPTASPTTSVPTRVPTASPTQFPTTAAPTRVPTTAPGLVVTSVPTNPPTSSPSQAPTAVPTRSPTTSPVVLASLGPTRAPTSDPTLLPTSGPTLVPTLDPTRASTSNPTRTPTSDPTRAPTSIPSHVPTSAPSTAQTATPVILPTPAPTALSPTLESSSSPSFTTLHAIAGTQLSSTFTLTNVGISDVPARDSSLFKSFVEVIETSIHKIIAGINGNDDSNVTVTHLDDIPVSGRQLDRLLVDEPVSMLDVDFVVVATRECFVSDCDAVALDISYEYKVALAEAVQDGSFDTELQDQAVELGVNSLKTAAILKGSLVVVNNSTFVTEVLTDGGSTQETVGSSSADPLVFYVAWVGATLGSLSYFF